MIDGRRSARSDRMPTGRFIIVPASLGRHAPCDPGGAEEQTMRDRKVVVVTGASAGLGRAIVRRFARDGAAIGLLARGVDGLEGARRDVERLGGKALVLPTDVSDANAVENAAAAVEAELGPIDIWVNDAMVSVFSPVKEMLAEEYHRVMNVTY